ncbi:hypothetical protein GF314_17355 [bacterium]|nr:hypothetical protein [bacterium]
MIRLLAVATLALLLAVAGCGGGDDTVTSRAQMESGTADAGNEAAQDAGSEAMPATITGEVLETIDSGGYTYAKVEGEDGAFWAAASPSDVAVGDEVTVSTAMPMRDFHAKSLDRTFDLIFFTTSFDAAETAGDAAEGMGEMPGMEGMGAMGAGHGRPDPVQTDVDLSGIAKADGGHTVAEIHAAGSKLAGEPVVVRGKVVKYTSSIMGRNWIHLRDGSGDPGADTHDLTVTTQGFAKVGDLVRIEGTLAANKDFGAGYRYDVIVEQAEVIKE